MVWMELIGFLAFPAILLQQYRSNPKRFILSPVLLCYGLGLLLANIPGLSPSPALLKELVEISIPLAIPLLLFQSRIKLWWGLTGKSLQAFLIGVFSISLSVYAISPFFIYEAEEIWKAAGMLVGVYSGGTPNLSAIGLSLEADSELFVLLNASDTVVSGIYLLFLMSVAKKLLTPFYPKSSPLQTAVNDEEIVPGKENWSWKEAALALLCSLLVLGLSAGISFLFTGKLSELIIILGISSFGILASNISSVQKLKSSYSLGEYFLLVFCLAVGSMSRFDQLIDGGGVYFLFCTCVFVGMLLLHYPLARLFRIDLDSLLIGSVAGVFGPVFIPQVATAIGNKKMIPVGISVALLGYGLANYWGIAMAYLVKISYLP